MQRRNFISHMALVLPAGVAAPKLLFEKDPTTSSTIKTTVLVINTGSAGLYITHQLKKQKINICLVHAEGYTAGSSSTKAAFVRQPDAHAKATVHTIEEDNFSAIKETAIPNFQPTSITKIENGFRVTDGKTVFETKKLVLSLPVHMDLVTASLQLKVAYQKDPLIISCKRKNQKNPSTLRTISASRMDEKTLIQFAGQKSPGILAVL